MVDGPWKLMDSKSGALEEWRLGTLLCSVALAWCVYGPTIQHTPAMLLIFVAMALPRQRLKQSRQMIKLLESHEPEPRNMKRPRKHEKTSCCVVGCNMV